ncbi:hypothetical protein [Ensifer adhaerens]|uniref:hypothetical protein n=1 Tax=Ensifer adhaerens TaxID=106592 RepID=UPI0015C4071D|nr:hypothetical protein [Ensifer adhaerens]
MQVQFLLLVEREQPVRRGDTENALHPGYFLHTDHEENEGEKHGKTRRNPSRTFRARASGPDLANRHCSEKSARREDQERRQPFDQAVFARKEAEAKRVERESQGHRRRKCPCRGANPQFATRCQSQHRRAQPSHIAGKSLNCREREAERNPGMPQIVGLHLRRPFGEVANPEKIALDGNETGQRERG